MQHYLIWSGGCDSSCIFMNLVRDKITPLTVISINHYNLGKRKQALEKGSRDKFLKFLEIKGYQQGSSYIHTEIKIDTGIQAAIINQPAMWLSTVLPYINFTNDDVTIYFGYIKHDDFWHIKSDFETIIHDFAKLRNAGKTPHTIEIKYPLEWLEKTRILEDLISQNVPVEALWWCESDSETLANTPCGNCDPCKHYYDALMKVEMNVISQDIMHHIKNYITLNSSAVKASEEYPQLTIKDVDKVADIPIAQTIAKSIYSGS